MEEESSEAEGLRDRLARQGEDALGKIAQDLLENPLSDRLRKVAAGSSIVEAYREAERIWREGTDVAPEHRPYSRLRSVTGLAGYYAVRLPFMAYKGYKEWYGKT